MPWIVWLIWLGIIWSPKITGLIPDQDRLNPQQKSYRRQLMDVLLSHQCFSLPLSKKVRLKKKEIGQCPEYGIFYRKNDLVSPTNHQYDCLLFLAILEDFEIILFWNICNKAALLSLLIILNVFLISKNIYYILLIGVVLFIHFGVLFFPQLMLQCENFPC